MGRDGLLQGGRDLSELVGSRRLMAGLVAVLVVGAGLVGLFLYHPASGTTSSPPFATEDPPVPVNGSYRVVAQTRSTVKEGTTYIEQTRTYTPGKPAVALGRWTFGGGAERTTVSSYERGTTRYRRQTWANVSVYRSTQDRLSEQAQSEGFFRAVNLTRTIYTTESIEGGVDAALPGSIPLLALGAFAYERRGMTTYQGREVARYVPQTGWVNHEPSAVATTVWVETASGEVLVDPETGVVLFADVNGKFTLADTWGEVLMKSSITQSVNYRIDTSVEKPEMPPWVPEIREVINSTREPTGSQ